MNYPGNKGGLIIKSKLLNFVPKADVYYSLFAGMAGLERCKELKHINWRVAEKNLELHSKLKPVLNLTIVQKDYTDLIPEIEFVSKTKKNFCFHRPSLRRVKLL